MNQVQKWGWNISWLESVPSVHLKWCQTSEQSELINANKDHIFIIIWYNLYPTLKNGDKFVLASYWPRPQDDQNPKFYFQVHNKHIRTILWNLSRDIEKNNHVSSVINFEWIALQNFDKTFEKTVWFLWKFEIISKIGRFWRENVLIPSF